MTEDDRRDDLIIRVVVVVTLGVVLCFAVVGLTVVAVATDRDMARPEFLTFGGVVMLAALGGVSWWSLRRHWRVRIERNGNGGNGLPRSRDLDIND